MKNSFCLSGLAAALLGLGVVHGQAPTYSPGHLEIPPASAPMMPAAPAAPAVSTGGPDNSMAPLFEPNQGGSPGQPEPASTGISSWLAYPRGPACCCRVGGNGPIDEEVYIRTGVSAPFGSGVLAANLTPGWDIEGGVRTLFFNKEGTAAWTADLSITNLHFNSHHNQSANITNLGVQTPNPLTGTSTTSFIPNQLVTPAGLNDTFVNLSGGRESYLWGGAGCCNGEPKLRVGWDVGGRWGTSRLDLDLPAGAIGTIGLERHKTGSISGLFLSVHSDLEVPCGCWILFAGVRAEYGYIFSDILQSQNDTDLQTFNLMLTIGGRF